VQITAGSIEGSYRHCRVSFRFQKSANAGDKAVFIAGMLPKLPGWINRHVELWPAAESESI
jgi:hypothetical protein